MLDSFDLSGPCLVYEGVQGEFDEMEIDREVYEPVSKKKSKKNHDVPDENHRRSHRLSGVTYLLKRFNGGMPRVVPELGGG